MGAALAIRPALGSTWSSATSVFGSARSRVAVVGHDHRRALRHDGGAQRARRGELPAPTPGGNASAALAEATTVKVPGENSKTFQSTVAGNATEQAENAKWVPLDPADQAALTQQLAQAYQAAERFPTVASAKAAGMILAGGMAPGVGAHYQLINGDVFKGINPDGSVNAAVPRLVDLRQHGRQRAGRRHHVRVVRRTRHRRVSSGPTTTGTATPTSACSSPTARSPCPFAADQDVTPQECADVHGEFMKKTVWMVHAWVVPGWESPQGVFSHDNLHVYCPGNTDLINAIGFCDRQS